MKLHIYIYTIYIYIYITYIYIYILKPKMAVCAECRIYLCEHKI